MSLYFIDACLSHLEVPNEAALCIYISGCVNHCSDCHYPQLQRNNYGDVLKNSYYQLIDSYSRSATCVCFLGEGKNRKEEREELRRYAEYAHYRELKTCLYSGRDVAIEDWMQIFDYIKLGSYKPECGPIDSPLTNQRLYKKTDDGYEDITALFRIS